jgi:hypothetical protein
MLNNEMGLRLAILRRGVVCGLAGGPRRAPIWHPMPDEQEPLAAREFGDFAKGIPDVASGNRYQIASA